MPRSRKLKLAGAGLACLVVMGIGSAVVGGAVGIAHGVGPATTGAGPRPAAPVVARGPLSRADRSARNETVLGLTRLVTPDVIVSLPRRAPADRLWKLQHQPGVRAVAVLDRGHIRLHGVDLPAVGVSPSEVRGFTPALTAKSDPLWQAVGNGDLTITYSDAHRFRHALGATLPVRGPAGRPVLFRLGAFASLGLGSAQAVVDHVGAQMLGLHLARELVVSAPQLSLTAITTTVHRVFGAHAVVHGARPETVDQSTISAYARATIPASYLALYRAAAGTCAGLPWTVLAAIGAVETGHGANNHVSSKGAVGPMQFLPSTFAVYGVDGGGDGVVDIHNPADAVYSAARYLCLWGAGRGGQSLYDAVWAYNHADWYVREVINVANSYA